MLNGLDMLDLTKVLSAAAPLNKENMKEVKCVAILFPIVSCQIANYGNILEIITKYLDINGSYFEYIMKLHSNTCIVTVLRYCTFRYFR